MKDIKFRGQRVDDGEWIYGSLIQKAYQYKGSKYVDTQSYKGWSPAIHEMVDSESYICISDFQDDPELIRVIPETVGQSCELKDKNGIDIYDGDKIKRNTSYMGKKGGNAYKTVGWILRSNYNGFNIAKGNNWEVVGNIHQNPNLIKEPSCQNKES